MQVRLVINKIRAAATRGTAVDMSELLSGYTNDVVCRAVLGESHRKEGRNRLFSELTEINVSLLGGFSLENYIPPNMVMADVLLRLVSVKAQRLNKRWDDLFNEIIEEHLHPSKPSSGEEQAADFIDLLLSLKEEYGLTTDNIKAILVVITFPVFPLQIIVHVLYYCHILVYIRSWREYISILTVHSQLPCCIYS